MTALSASTLGDFDIVEIPFTDKPQSHLKDEPKGSNWPVVYILSGKKDKQKRLYVGETSNFKNRLKQHQDNPNRQYVSSVQIIF
jgi:hypothetical protein